MVSNGQIPWAGFYQDSCEWWRWDYTPFLQAKVTDAINFEQIIQNIIPQSPRYLCSKDYIMLKASLLFMQVADVNALNLQPDPNSSRK